MARSQIGLDPLGDGRASFTSSEVLDEVNVLREPTVVETNRPGLRHVAFKVDDVSGVVDRVRAAGWETVGEIVDYENSFLLCYVRGPEALIVELAERVDGTSG